MAKTGPSSLQDRLHRIEGQIRGIEKQIESGQEVQKVLIQIEAVISSLGSLKLEMVKKEIRNNLLSHVDEAISLLK